MEEREERGPRRVLHRLRPSAFKNICGGACRCCWNSIPFPEIALLQVFAPQSAADIFPNEEIQPLNSPSSVQPLNNPGMTNSNSKKRHLNLLERLMLNVDERVSVKVLMHIWGPRLEFVVRLMLVATFLDDSLRMAMHFSQHVE